MDYIVYYRKIINIWLRGGSQRFFSDKILLNYAAAAKKQYLCLYDVIYTLLTS